MASVKILPLAEFKPSSSARAWVSIPNPNGLPLIATATSDKNVRVYSLEDFTLHSTLEGGHERSVRSVSWQPTTANTHNAPVLVTGSFDATMGIWRWNDEQAKAERTDHEPNYEELEIEIGSDGKPKVKEPKVDEDWDFVVVLEGHDSEIKTVGWSPSGQWLASCSRDKSIWVWEEIGAQGEDEYETVAVLQEHDADVKYVCWRKDDGNGEVLASASYDDTIRLWREDGEGEWESFATLEGHGGTVWSLDWEPEVSLGIEPGGDEAGSPENSMSAILGTPRLLSSSADNTIRVWSLGEARPPNKPSYFNPIPNTMRRPIYETWNCTATLPPVHDLPIYSVSWSKKSGRVVSTGGDGKIAIYEEVTRGRNTVGGEIEKDWVVLAVYKGAHGPYEVNHVTWCTRYDEGKKQAGEEMIVTTGDDGIARAWAVEDSTSASGEHAVSPGEQVDTVMQGASTS